ncbi:hypothetical protein KR093_003186, partial [Drosophila rubida]
RLSHKAQRDLWYGTNRNIIMSLARILGLHADVVFDFLYMLTLQNFGKVLNPRGHSWNVYRVPLSNVAVCDYYAGIFDSEGNVRNPFHPDVLEQLLAMMQQVLKDDKSPSSPAELRLPTKEPRRERTTKRISERAGIGPNSVARANGIRRRYQIGERYELTGGKPGGGGGGGCDLWRKYARQFSKLWEQNEMAIKGNEVAVLDWDAVKDHVGDHEEYHDGEDHELTKPEVHIQERLYEMLYTNMAKARGRELKRLLLSVQQQTGMRSDLAMMLDVVRQLDIKMALQGELQYMKDLSQKLSEEYNALAAATRHAPSHVLKYRHPAHHNTANRVEPPAVADKKLARFYYGAPVPVLMHEPFDAAVPRTWIRRHPDAMRLNEKGEIVQEGAARYKRQSVQQRLTEARRKYSIHSVYSGDDLFNPNPKAAAADNPKRD